MTATQPIRKYLGGLLEFHKGRHDAALGHMERLIREQRTAAQRGVYHSELNMGTVATEIARHTEAIVLIVDQLKELDGMDRETRHLTAVPDASAPAHGTIQDIAQAPWSETASGELQVYITQTTRNTARAQVNHSEGTLVTSALYEAAVLEALDRELVRRGRHKEQGTFTISEITEKGKKRATIKLVKRG